MRFFSTGVHCTIVEKQLTGWALTDQRRGLANYFTFQVKHDDSYFVEILAIKRSQVMNYYFEVSRPSISFTFATYRPIDKKFRIELIGDR
jgi:hypothetical protein